MSSRVFLVQMPGGGACRKRNLHGGGGRSFPFEFVVTWACLVGISQVTLFAIMSRFQFQIMRVAKRKMWPNDTRLHLVHAVL